MVLPSGSAIVVLVCRVFSPDGTLLCETAGIDKPPTTLEDCQIAADTVRDAWNEINNYATWDAWTIACPALPDGLTENTSTLPDGAVQRD